jgi:hypothetical protein
MVDGENWLLFKRDFRTSDVQIQDSAATEMPEINKTNLKLPQI